MNSLSLIHPLKLARKTIREISAVRVSLRTLLLLCNTSFLIIFLIIILYLLRLQNESITLRSNLQIQSDVVRQVEERVTHYAEHASEVLQYFYRLAHSDLQKYGAVRAEYFFNLASTFIRANKKINALYYGSDDGSHYMVKRVRNGQIGQRIVENDGNIITVKWSFPLGKRPGSYSEYREFSLDEGYDPRSRDWYQAAKTEQESWIGPYAFYTDDFAGLTGSIGIEDRKGKKSVFAMDLDISYLNESLHDLPFAKLGYIVVKNGSDEAVAISDKKNNYKEYNRAEITQISFDSSSNQQYIGIRTISQLHSSPVMSFFAKSILPLEQEELRSRYPWRQKDNLVEELLKMFFPKYARSSNIRSILLNGVDYGSIKTDSDTYLFTRNEFSSFPGLNWIAYTLTDSRDYNSSLNYIAKIISWIFLGFVLLFIIILQYISKQIAGPLGELSNMMRDFSQHLKLDQNFHTNDIRIKVEEICNIGNIYNDLQNGFRSFKKFVPDVIVRRSMNSTFLEGNKISAQMKKNQTAILFSDIEGFTSISESLEPQVLCECLEIYFSTMSEAIGQYDGLIDKFIGDAVMALFGAFRSSEESDKKIAEQAVAAALAMQGSSLIINKKAQKIVPSIHFKTRIGISIGEVMVGIMGAEQRLNFTAIGDCVNLASRLESLNKEYGTGIIVSERSRDLASELFTFRYLGKVNVRGKTEAENVYEPIAYTEELSQYERSYYENFSKLQRILENDEEGISQKVIELFEEHFSDMTGDPLLLKMKQKLEETNL